LAGNPLLGLSDADKALLSRAAQVPPSLPLPSSPSPIKAVSFAPSPPVAPSSSTSHKKKQQQQQRQEKDGEDEDEEAGAEAGAEARATSTVNVAIAGRDRFGKFLHVTLPAAIKDDRQALVAFFRATGGPRWKNKKNWCSALPLSTWHGVHVGRNGQVLRLLLPYNALAGDVPSVVGCLAGLVELDLRYNQLSALTPALGALSSLRALYLHCNKLAGAGLPTELAGCRALEVLDLHSNALTGMVQVEALASLPALQHVNLASNLWDSKTESVDRVRRALPHCRAVLL
jgi:hypothetical protein